MVDSLVRLDAVRAVLGGRGVVEVARACGVSRQSVHTWLSRYLVEGVSGLADRSHRPKECPHQAPPAVEAQVAEMRPGASAVGCETDQIHRAYLERRRPAAPGVDRFLVAAPARALDKRHRSFEAVLRRAPRSGPVLPSPGDTARTARAAARGCPPLSPGRRHRDDRHVRDLW